jgi:hypothetical protein
MAIADISKRPFLQQFYLLGDKALLHIIKPQQAK